MANEVRPFRPDYTIHPGEFIAERIESDGLRQAEAAVRLGVSEKHLSQLIHGKASVTPEMAMALARVFDTTETYWLSLQATYDADRARRSHQERIQDQADAYRRWLALFDYKVLASMGFLGEGDDDSSEYGRISRLLSFFGCRDLEAWNELYRSDLPAACLITGGACTKLGNATAWIRHGQRMALASTRDLPKYDKGLFRTVLQEIRGMAAAPPEGFADRMAERCRDAGVHLSFQKEIPRSGICGAAFWIKNSSSPCILMSLRHKKNDHFWFTFFHEAGHVLAEHKRDVYLDCVEPSPGDVEEQANGFASRMLIPPRDYDRFVQEANVSLESIRRFSSRIGMHPGVVVGRLQHDGLLPWDRGNTLKQTMEWDS